MLLAEFQKKKKVDVSCCLTPWVTEFRMPAAEERGERPKKKK